MKEASWILPCVILALLVIETVFRPCISTVTLPVAVCISIVLGVEIIIPVKKEGEENGETRV